MQLPRWLMILMLGSSATGVVAAGALWWVTWPERTAQEEIDSHQRLLADSDGTVRDEAPSVLPSLADQLPASEWRMENFSREPRSVTDFLRGRQTFRFDRAGYEFTVERGHVVEWVETISSDAFDSICMQRSSGSACCDSDELDRADGFAGELRKRVPDFVTQVIPVLTKLGCNSGACHGAAIGRGGLKLSLLGYDPQADHESLTGEFEGRRINVARPERSLVLRKPSGDLPHQGGIRLADDSEAFAMIRDWIAAGAPRASTRTLQSIAVTPSSQWLAEPGSSFSIRVTARFQSGPDREEDVTRWAVFTPTDPAAVDVTPAGEVTVRQRGQNSVMIRFLGEVACVTATVPIGDEPVPADSRRSACFIDDQINRKLDDLRLPNSDRSDDRTFARRLFLDLIGTLPEPAEIDSFVADESRDKRAKLTERLLDRPEFVDFWSYKWGDLLRVESGRLQAEGAAAFHEWIRDAVARNRPLDEMARELVLATGDGYANGAVNFSRVPGDARIQAEHVSQVFLGLRLQCANCHNHPLDRWTQDDYHGLAAVFAKLKRGRSIELQSRGDVIHPKTGEPTAPRIPGVGFLEGDSDPRDEFAAWLTAPDNPHFARAAVNRIWRELMGRGLVEPLDDHRETNPATHPELLNALARDFIEHRFDVRHTIREIVASEAYQRSSTSVGANRTDDRFYSKYLVRRLPPAVLVDAVAKVTGVPEPLGSVAAGTTAISLGDSRIGSEPLDLLGRCAREAACNASSPGAGSAGSLPLALHMINGAWLNAKITHPDGRLHKMLRERHSTAEFVTKFMSIALGRSPNESEIAQWDNQLATADDRARAETFEDFVWALLNSAEFSGNH